ncbi:MAG: hypothetical protein RL095_3945 [Verrucomicrobiota bacterium]|jgi:hypothetical protein
MDSLYEIFTHSLPKTQAAAEFADGLLAGPNLDVETFHRLYSGAPRRLGRDLPLWSGPHRIALSAFPVDLSVETRAQLGRILLATVCSPELLRHVLLRGDEGEQAAALRALNLRDDAADFKLDAVNCARSNSAVTFGALAQNNPYPAAHFDDREFIHMLVKTIFLGLKFSAVVGRHERFCDEMARVLADLLAERRSAGRSLPDDALVFMNEKGIR